MSEALTVFVRIVWLLFTVVGAVGLIGIAFFAIAYFAFRRRLVANVLGVGLIFSSLALIYLAAGGNGEGPGTALGAGIVYDFAILLFLAGVGLLSQARQKERSPKP